MVDHDHVMSQIFFHWLMFLFIGDFHHLIVSRFRSYLYNEHSHVDLILVFDLDK